MTVYRPVLPALLVALALAFPLDAWAYLDAGTGSYLFQLAVAGLLAGMMTIKIYYQRIKFWFQARRTPPPLPAPDDSKPTV